MPKVSVYVTSEQKSLLLDKSIQCHLSLSQYLLQSGLQNKIESSAQKAQFASIACKLYALSDEMNSPEQRDTLRNLGGAIYGLLED